jgi:D-aminopeptidase
MGAHLEFRWALLFGLAIMLGGSPEAPAGEAGERVRAREFGIAPGVLTPGPLNAITDVAGVRVGHRTLIRGDDVRTGVTAILPHGGNLFRDKVPAGLAVANGFGKLVGSTQLVELGELETPVVLTNTLSVGRAAEAVVDWTLRQPGNEDVVSVNAVVGETNDARLNNIRARGVTAEDVLAAIEGAREGEVAEGSVGAGTGTVAFGWKGGIGTSSRRLPASLGGHTVGVLVQSNYGGVLTIDGAPVGREFGQYYLRDALPGDAPDGSIMIVIATDAPLADRNLTRLAWRAFAGVARTGASFSNGSGDYAIAFSTVRVDAPAARLSNDAMSPLFQAVAEATEEAIYNSLLMATTISSVDSRSGAPVTVEAIDLERLRGLLRQCGVGPR